MPFQVDLGSANFVTKVAEEILTVVSFHMGGLSKIVRKVVNEQELNAYSNTYAIFLTRPRLSMNLLLQSLQVMIRSG